MQETYFIEKIQKIREKELDYFATYVNLKVIFSSIYFNSGTILSALLFMFVDTEQMKLGEIFSTLALLGYLFNFSVLYSNYAIEALNSLFVL
jgi:hypothetical protein